MNLKTLKQKPIAAMAIIFLMALPLLLAINTASAVSPATGTISARFIDENGDAMDPLNDLALPSDAVGQNVYVLLKVTGGARIWSLKTDLSWNNQVLALTEVARGNAMAGTTDFLTRSPNAETLLIGTDSSTWKVAANGTGYVSGGISDTRMVGTATTLATGDWVTLTFTVVGSGDCNIVLSNGIVTNIDGTQSPATVNGAHVAVAPAFVTPEYPIGALAAMAVAFAAFIGFAAFKKGVSFPVFSKRVA